MAKTLQIVASIVARDNTIVRTSTRLEGTVGAGKIVSDIRKVDSKIPIPYEVKIFTGLAALVDQMVNAGINGTVFIASSVMPRYLQTRKLIDRHNAVDIMTTAWMKKSENLEHYRMAFKTLLASLRRAKNNDVLVIVRDVRELYRVKLEGATGLHGLYLDIRNGINEEYGVRVVGNSRFAGTVKVCESLENDEIVSYGKIVEDSLFGKAKSFISYGKETVQTAMSLLPTVESKVEETTVNSEDF